MAVGSRRTDDDRRRTLFRSDRRPAPAHVAVGPIARSVLCPPHGVVDERDLSLERSFGRRFQSGQRRKIGQLEIGRASCRERVGQYVEISGVAGYFKKKKN